MTSRGLSERGRPKNQSGARRRIEDGDELWEDHITYTRNYVINALADLPDSMRSPNRLLRNQDDYWQCDKAVPWRRCPEETAC
jgi:hypothetical protein